MKILRTYGGTEWCADPCAVLVDPSYYDEYQREADAIFKAHPNIDKVRFGYVGTCPSSWTQPRTLTCT
mgnify:CR=1 FL=1